MTLEYGLKASDRKTGFFFCVKTNRGIYFGMIMARDQAQADRLVRQYLLNLGHQEVAQIRYARKDELVKEAFVLETFNEFVE